MDAKERVKELMTMREAIEREINERVTRLEAPGGAGRTGSLVDAEGFPRTDIDVHAARVDRQRVIVLTNDHKAITDQIQEALIELHAQTRNTGQVGPRTTSQEAGSPAADQAGHHPFAYVDGVSPDSPATDAGIQCGDQLCQFGNIIGRPSRNDGILTNLAASVKANEGKEVQTVFLRDGEVVKMTLTPRRWGGPGLIGCHLRPLP